MQTDRLEILVLGASYGLLPGVKLALAGHKVTFVARPDEISLLAAGPLNVRIPLRRGNEQVVLTVTPKSQAAVGSPALRTPQDVDPSAMDFVLLAMQEPHFAAPEVAALLARIGKARCPCLSIMNLPPPPYLKRIGIKSERALHGVFTSEQVWDPIDPTLLAVASPDPQAFRADPDRPGDLVVTLASNFKASTFGAADAQRTLERLAHDVSHLKVRHGNEEIRPPVALVAHTSPFAPLAKWPMVLTGNFRCLTSQGVRSISEAVHDDVEESREIYDAVCSLAGLLGATSRDLVKFEDYAHASKSLTRPSSVARALASGAIAVERLDKLVDNLGKLNHRSNEKIHRIVEAVDARLATNRAQSVSVGTKG